MVQLQEGTLDSHLAGKARIEAKETDSLTSLPVGLVVDDYLSKFVLHWVAYCGSGVMGFGTGMIERFDR